MSLVNGHAVVKDVMVGAEFKFSQMPKVVCLIFHTVILLMLLSLLLSIFLPIFINCLLLKITYTQAQTGQESQTAL